MGGGGGGGGGGGVVGLLGDFGLGSSTESQASLSSSSNHFWMVGGGVVDVGFAAATV